MTAPHLWLHGDPTEGRAYREPPTEEHPTVGPAAATRETPSPSLPVAARPPRGRGRFAAGLAGGAVSAALVTGGLFSLGALENDAPSSASAAPAAAAPAIVGARQSGDVGAIYAAASQGVVSVRTGGGSGTGFVVNRDGTLVTNAHVVGEASTVQVHFKDRDQLVTGRVAGTDPSSDLAVIRIDPADAGGNLRVLPLADSDQVRVGQLAVAIGSPFGLEQTATSGIVSGLEREIRAPDGFQIDEVIQTDAPINPGNSGGPLLNARGQVIGVNSQIQTGGANGNVGIGFAVPANTVREVLPRLARGETIERAYLGIASGPGANGPEVQSVAPGSPAASAGLRAGDVLQQVDGDQVDAPEDVTDALDDRGPGDEIAVTIRRGGQEQSLDVRLGTRPAEQP